MGQADMERLLQRAVAAREGEYAVLLVQMEAAGEGQLAALAAFLAERLRTHRLAGGRPLPYRGGFLLVVAGDSLRRAPRGMLLEWQQDFEARFGVRLGIACGGAYPLSRLGESFREARIAGVFHSVAGDWGFVQKYKTLGIFASLFAAGEDDVAAFCRRVLGDIEAYDRAYGTALIETLRVLLHYDFNWKRSAAALFVHVNTLRYRYDKMAEVIEQDMGRMEVRANLFAALRARDILDYLGAWERCPRRTAG